MVVGGFGLATHDEVEPGWCRAVAHEALVALLGREVRPGPRPATGRFRKILHHAPLGVMDLLEQVVVHHGVLGPPDVREGKRVHYRYI